MIDLDDVPAARTLPQARRLAEYQSLRTLPASTGSARVSRRRLLVVGSLVGVPVLVGATAAAVELLPSRAASVHDSGRCYSMVSTDFGDDFPGSSMSVANQPGQPPADTSRGLVDGCTTLWRGGGLRLGDPQAGDYSETANLPVPPLVACVLPSGEAAVFPGPASTCATLGLAPLATG
jgi:hypothetical protein